MGVFLSQLPTVKIAHLKVELAETLVANFCYPRFFDYRTNSLRMRPVDREKRQEVWLYLSSIDFRVWNDVDVTSPGFRHQIEHIFIRFVQQNNNFYGQQGRKRITDIRMLISACASQVTKGLHEYLLNHQEKASLFGSPRPVPSWATVNPSMRSDPSWEQIGATTMQLQLQLQEVRGEVEAAAALRTVQERQAENVVGDTKQELTTTDHTPAVKSMHVRVTPSAPAPTVAVPPVRKVGAIVPPVKAPPLVRARLVGTAVPQAQLAGSLQQAQPAQESLARATTKLPTPLDTTASTAAPLASVAEGGIPLVTEDIAIFEQMRHQLVLWLRMETVRVGVDVVDVAPLQLLELLRQRGGFDGTRLQVASTLLHLSNQVIKNGQASFFDYKQALMLYLIHAR